MSQPPYGQQPSGPYPPNQPPYPGPSQYQSPQYQSPQYQSPQQPSPQQPAPPYQAQQPPQPQYQPSSYQRPQYHYGLPSEAPQQGQGFGWGPQFAPPSGPGGPGGFQPGWQPQLPRKKRSKGPLIAILSCCVLAVVGLWMFGVIRKNANDTPYTHPTYNVPTNGPTSSEPTSQPTDEPSEPQPTTTTTKPATPPPSPLSIVANNKLYRTGVQRTVNCKEAGVRPNNARNAAAYWARIKPCLDRAWAAPVAKAGYRFKAPAMSYWAGTSVSTPCGGGAVSVPFYCPTNQMMYMKVDVFVKSYNQYPDADSKAYARMWYTRSIAHEYGHHVQNLTGILQAETRLSYESNGYAAELLLSRRTELQANCFAGVFLAANKRSYPINGALLRAWNKWVVTAGDAPGKGTHGSPASQKRFMGRSFVTGNPASCNTYKASPASVS
ncbi:neutral zinc metallopeptidase [Kribbella sp. VKM Ac-2568]|uniref:neutral zinc metallopeptidase n=1 Tax=Kribbella sp. VKM Ac-2568 TaxID=2512219 RepID=UPI0010540341|nr:neutral zinc metallopeptidase [Kribbella sp. VKM Ac-2568]TCM46527.1 hypothetical protein EV648_1054 [Kribbella sp. VKM Ac-2568]